jgi:hypothetical protein
MRQGRLEPESPSAPAFFSSKWGEVVKLWNFTTLFNAIRRHSLSCYVIHKDASPDPVRASWIQTTSCNSIQENQKGTTFRWNILQGRRISIFNSEEGRNRCLRNVGAFLPNYTLHTPEDSNVRVHERENVRWRNSRMVAVFRSATVSQQLLTVHLRTM